MRCGADVSCKQVFVPSTRCFVPQLSVSLRELSNMTRIVGMFFTPKGVPLRPMLGKITRDVQDMLDVLHGHDFQAEYKYDGVRAQIHLSCSSQKRKDAKLFMFSRHLEDVTTRYPDVLSALLDSVAAAPGTGARGRMNGAQQKHQQPIFSLRPFLF